MHQSSAHLPMMPWQATLTFIHLHSQLEVIAHSGGILSSLFLWFFYPLKQSFILLSNKHLSYISA